VLALLAAGCGSGSTVAWPQLFRAEIIEACERAGSATEPRASAPKTRPSVD
jgi:hypothetical protein